MPALEDDDAMLRALVQLTESQHARLEAMRETVIDLQRRLQARSDIEVLLGHELRTPVEVIRDALAALREDVPADARDEIVNRAVVQAGYLADVAEDLLTPEKDVGAHVPRARLRTVGVHDLVRQAITAAHLDDAVTTRVDERTTVSTAPARVVAILVQLLGEGTKVRSRLAADGEVVIEVLRPGGPPAPAALYLVRMLARTLGGAAVLAGRTGSGTTVSLHLPQRRAEDPTPVVPTGRSGDESR